MIKQLEFAGQNTREKRSIVRENCGDLQKSLLESLVEYGFVSEDGETLGRSRVKNNQSMHRDGKFVTHLPEQKVLQIHGGFNIIT